MKVRWILRLSAAACALGILASATGCDDVVGNGTTSTSTTTQYKIRYEFTGTRSAEVSYIGTGSEVVKTVTPPWSFEFTTTDSSRSVKVSAFSLSSGSATVKLYINGSLKKSDSDGSTAGFHAFTGTYKIKDLL